MSNEHRYSDQEIAAIFEKAAEAQEAAHSGLSHREGLTLAELQQIGEEAGISPEFIARAAANMVTGHPKAKPSVFLGFPISVEQSVNVPGAFADDEWDRLVVDLRETFRATGTVARHGELREWRNGNLHALVEPTDTGHRLRIRTTKGSAGQSVFGGSALVAVALTLLIIRLVTGDLGLDSDSLVLGMLALAGLGMVGQTRASLPRWAAERSKQMENVTRRVLERMAVQPTESVVEPAASARIDLDALPEIAGSEIEGQRDRTRA